MKHKIKTELCDCGHIQLVHTDTFTKGHGRCLYNGCKCLQFTWKEFITIERG